MADRLAEDELVERLAAATGKDFSDTNSHLNVIRAEIEALSVSLHVPPTANDFLAEPQLADALKRASELATDQTTAPPTSSDHVGAPTAQPMLGQYELLEKLGSGGMGTVYRAVHRKLNRTVAIKVLPADRFQSPDAVARFEREMRAVGMLQHPNIVAAHDAGEHEGQHFLVMEYVEGLDLAQLVARTGPLPITEACEIIRQAALGLQQIGDSGLVHRDLKPSNLMLAQTRQRRGAPTVKILDLGLALLESTQFDSPRELTSTGQVMGTIDYMSPEQALDTHSVDIRADLYSLGATLFKLLTGQAPLESPQRNTVMKRLIALERDEPPPVTTLRPDCPRELADLVRRLLSKSPNDRPEEPQALADLLAPFATGANLTALLQQATTGDLAGVDAASFQLTVTTPQASTLVSTPLPQELASSRRATSVWRWLIVAALPLAVLLVIVILVSTDKGEVTITAPDDLKEPVHVSLLRNGASVVKNWQIKPGQNSHRVQTGTIEVQLPAEIGDEFELEAPGDLVVRRGKEVAYRLTRRKIGSPTASTAPAEPPSAPPPLAMAPFNTAQARLYQEAWAMHLGVPVEFTNRFGMEFRLIPPGEFLMGSSPEEIELALKLGGQDKDRDEGIKSEAPQHRVRLTKPFYLGVHEITQRQYQTVTGKTPPGFSKTGTLPEAMEKVTGIGTARFPVEMVSWADAEEFCTKLSEKESLSAFDHRAGATVAQENATGYRLPTEAQWEFACRAGTSTKFWNGEQNEDHIPVGWFHQNSGQRTHAVGESKANPFGLCDMHGNVAEWVHDGWKADFYQQFSDKVATDPRGPFLAGAGRVIRGGSFNFGEVLCRSSFRFAQDPVYYKTHGIGFRVALSIDALRKSIVESRLQVSEPPVLDEWLKGRTVITVAQDGSGQFQTVQAALKAVGSGQAVKILDVGPYRERLQLDYPPADIGLISEVNTVIELPEWAPIPDRPEHRLGHSLWGTNDFRLSGLVFRFPQAEAMCLGINCDNANGLTVEQCFIDLSSPGLYGSALAMSNADLGPVKPCCIRECRIRGHINFGSNSEMTSGLIVRNLFEGSANGATISLGWKFASMVIAHNVFLDRHHFHQDLWTDNQVQGLRNIDLLNNTSLTVAPLGITKGALGKGRMRIQGNLRIHAGIAYFAEAAEKVLKTPGLEWSAGFNGYPRALRPNEHKIAAERTLPPAETDVLSLTGGPNLDERDRDFLRIPLDSPFAKARSGGDAPAYIGALPPGTAPPNGDWFTRLRDRWSK